MDSIKEQFQVNEDGIGLWKLSDSPITKTVEELGDVLVDLDCSGRVVSVEVIDFNNVDEQRLQKVLSRYVDLYKPQPQVQLTARGLTGASAAGSIRISCNQTFSIAGHH